MSKELPTHTLEVKVHGIGANTISLVEKAIQLKDKSNSPLDSVWVVFDRDSFPEDNFDNAIHKAEANGIKCAWSNEAFELWFLLHFQFVSHSISRDDYKNYLEREFIAKGNKGFTYLKNANDMYELLKSFGSEVQAIAFAKKLRTKHTDNKYSTHNPCTYVDVLISELRNPLDLLKDN